jgi:hypothetical protein
MQGSDGSNRPFLTVEPLGIDLGMRPVQDDSTNTDGHIFDNTYHKKKYKACLLLHCPSLSGVERIYTAFAACCCHSKPAAQYMTGSHSTHFAILASQWR